MKSDLHGIVSRRVPPEPWSEGEKIPWDDPAFSERMLAEHLSQAHDAASRRSETVDRQVAWIHNSLLKPPPANVLDLGCGPGLYANRLARLVHTVRGIDFSPASIRHAQAEAERAHLTSSFDLADIRAGKYGVGYDLAMLLFGEINVFKRDDALAILRHARNALRPDGNMLVEAHTFDAVRAIGSVAPRWRTVTSGLFSDRPHLLLEEAFWNDEQRVATHRWFVVDAATGAVERHVDSMQAYTEAEYAVLLQEAGFRTFNVRPDWPAAPGQEDQLMSFVAKTPSSSS